MQETIVHSSARAIRSEQLNIENQTTFLPTYMTMNEFISKLCIVEDYALCDNDTRVLLLLEASDFKSFSELKIQRNFFTFTKNSSYIFKFFEELSAEKFDINELDTHDIYAQYEEHIAILQELYKRYEKVCQNKKILDKIFLPKLYKFNKNFVKRLKNITLHVDGHLTNFELELLQKSCEYANIKIVFNTTAFNLKMQNKFLDLGIELQKNQSYVISLNDKKVLSQSEITQNTNIKCESFSESILQIAFVKHKIYEFIQKGYKAENIAVILPDENMAKMLKLFDKESNLNFAMGESFALTQAYERLNATCQLLDNKSKENISRLSRVGDETYMQLCNIYHKSSSEANIMEFLENFTQGISDKAHQKIFKEELFSFEKILPYMQNMPIKSLLNLFLQRLSSKSIDDVRGGEITVMGVLETRNVSFDAVIIVDFNDSFVPRKSDKDMFLNTQIRQMASLPTMNDRENLQKHYYNMLINASKEVAISYVNSSDKSASKFLKQLNINTSNLYNELDYASLLFDESKPNKKEETPIVLDYSFKTQNLSATKLKTFLTCKRKYYYKYIERINSHVIEKDMPQEHEIGSGVHLALKELYSKKNSYLDVQELKKDIDKELDKVCGESELDKYLIDIQKRKMQKFAEDEVKRFKAGYKVAYCEENLSREFEGIKLVGQIDRIDIKDNKVTVLDYKTGSYTLYNKNNFTQATDFQLEFYYLLAGEFGDIECCAFYDLKETKIVDECFLEDKLNILKSIIKDLLNLEQINFEKTDEDKHCTHCEYADMCGR